MDVVIFDDLGSGTSYGAFSVAGAGPAHQQLAFSLNANAISDLNDARGGFFSLGGTLTSAEGNDFLFGSTQQVGQSLVLVPVPEPSTGLLVTMALIGLALQRRSAGSTRYSAW